MAVNRRSFFQGLLATIAATPAVKFTAQVADKILIKPAGVAWRWMIKPLLNSGAWDANYKTYDEARKASDKIAEEVISRMGRP